MSCPTCSALFACINYGEVGVFQCERCGTLLVVHAVTGTSCTYVPKLVERCRKLAGVLAGNDAFHQLRTLGIAESINLPGQRSPE